MAWAVTAVVAGCATPTETAIEFASARRFEQRVVVGDPFRHLVLARPGKPADPVHVYIEHDGTPWVDGVLIARDPTPRRPLALELAATDSAPVLYVGRPCYFQVEDAPPCRPALWTHRRFAPEVIASVATAITRELASRGQAHAILIGYSGGGTLATLLAARIPQTVAVVTVAANLDIEAWAAHHDYSPLEGSVNPATEPPLPGTITVIHYFGTRDRVVPPETYGGYRQRHPRARFVEVKDYDHVCCWIRNWTQLLEEALGAYSSTPPPEKNKVPPQG